jgi:hypothetical protein
MKFVILSYSLIPIMLHYDVTCYLAKKHLALISPLYVAYVTLI